MLFLTAIAVPLLLMSLVLAAQGFWLVLPFAGLELVILFACFYLVSHEGQRCEVVSISASRVMVEKGRNRVGGRRGGPQERAEFPRAWVRVDLSGGDTWYPSRLWLGASGRRIEIGDFLVDDEKATLAADLKRWLSA